MNRLYKISFCLLSFLSALIVYSQQSNNWVQYNQIYYKFPISQTGVFKIPYASIQSAGIPIATINPKNIHLYLLGEEIPIYISGENDNTFDPNDFIEFYASNRSIKVDEKLFQFKNGESYLNPYSNLISDSVAVFFTWNNSNGLRYQIVTDTVISNANKITNVTFENIVSRDQGYHQGRLNFYEIASPNYNSAEGKGGAALFAKPSSGEDIANLLYPHLAKTSNVQYTVKFAGVNARFGTNNHRAAVYYKDSLNQFVKIKDITFSNYEVIETQFSLPLNAVSTVSEIKIKSLDSSIFNFNSAIRPIYYKEVYQNPIANYFIDNKSIIVADDPILTKSYLDLSAYQQSPADFIIYDITTNKKINVFISSSNKKIAIIPNANIDKKIFITYPANVLTINTLRPVNTTGTFVNYGLKQNNNPFLIISNRALENSVGQYANYRNQKFTVSTAYIQDLQDQYGYGILRHPLAIKNFIAHAIDSCPILPKHILLIGKGLSPIDVAAKFPNINLVPSIGDNPSDLYYTTDRSDSIMQPKIAIGRIAALTNSEVETYLDKVKTFEADTLPEIWKKEVALFSGGKTLNENQIFEGYLNGYKNQLKNDFYGGTFKLFNKNSSAPIGNLLSDTIKSIINNGVNMLVFFGHGSTQGFDVNIDNPNVYSNINKYPFLISNSCYSGNFYTSTTTSLSETWTFIPQKGSIGFLASSNIGIAYALNNYSLKLFEEIGKSSYGKPIGDIIKKTAQAMLNSTDELNQSTAFDMNYQGDPALKISSYQLPDYTINDNFVTITESSNPDSLKIIFQIQNLAKSISDSISIKIKRIFGNNDTMSVQFKRPCPKFTDTLSFVMLKDLVKGPGVNYFQIILDEQDLINEYNENNNATSFNISYFVQSNDIIPIYPPPFAIIDKDSITLMASTLDPLAKSLRYFFEISKNSEFTTTLANTNITNTGGIIAWKLPIVLQDSSVYYWRVRIDSNLTQNKIKWRTSSFQYIKNKTGWAQADYPQFLDNTYQFIKTNKLNKDFTFQNEVKELTFNTGFYGSEIFNLDYSINGNKIDQGFCSLFANGWIMVAIDSITGQPFQSDRNSNTILPPGASAFPVRYGQYFNCHCLDQPWSHFAYIAPSTNSFEARFNCQDTLWKEHLKYFFNTIPNGTYLVAFSAGKNNKLSTFDNDLMTHFENMGANNIRNYPDTIPVIIYGKKGIGKGKGKEFVGTSPSEKITTTDSLVLKWPFGGIRTELIGPAKKWDKIVWKYNGYNNNSLGDTIALNVYGVRADQSQQFLFTVPEDSLSFDLTNKNIDSIYPYLRFEAFLNDKVLTTPAQIRKWQVFYTPFADLAIDANKGLQIKTNVQEGEVANAIIPITNVSSIPITKDIAAQIWIDNKNGSFLQSATTIKAPVIGPFSTYFDTVSTSTLNNVGGNKLSYDLNNPKRSKAQIESNYFNNTVQLNFQVSSDKTNPILDVSFDGVHILDGDIVSSQPNILIQTFDENLFLALDDTSAYDVFLKYPNETSARKLYFNTLKFTKAQLPNNTSKIEFQPTLEQNGIYKLEVNAKDKSNNKSGKNNFKINFEVINESTMTEILNYPNPFSSQTRFVYTLTGNIIPDHFKVMIYTISGKQIRVLDLSNDPIKIGKNISTTIWDGRDEYGDAVGNGIYLYKVIAKYQGKSIELRQSGADAFISKGFGKMYLMR